MTQRGGTHSEVAEQPRRIPTPETQKGARFIDNDQPALNKGARRCERRSEIADRLLDVQEAAAMLGLAPATLYKWAHERRLRIVKLFGPRGALRFRLSDLQRLIDASTREARRALRA